MKRKLILGIDFDGTITSSNAWPRIEGIAKNAKEVINELHDVYNVIIIIWTCRDNSYHNDLDKAKQFLIENNIHFDYINCNAKEIMHIWNNNPRKVFADFYIDDRSFLFEDIDWLKIKNYIVNYKNKNKEHFL